MSDEDKTCVACDNPSSVQDQSSEPSSIQDPAQSEPDFNTVFTEKIGELFKVCKDKLHDPESIPTSPEGLQDFLANTFTSIFSVVKYKPDTQSQLCPIEDLLNIRLKMSRMLKDIGIQGPIIDEFSNCNQLESFYREAEKGSLSVGDILGSYVNNVTVPGETKEFLTGLLNKVYLDLDSNPPVEPELSSPEPD